MSGLSADSGVERGAGPLIWINITAPHNAKLRLILRITACLHR